MEWKSLHLKAFIAIVLYCKMVIELIDPFKCKEQLVNIHNVQRSINCCLDHDKSFSNNKEIIQIILGETRLALATLWWLDLCPVFGI